MLFGNESLKELQLHSALSGARNAGCYFSRLPLSWGSGDGTRVKVAAFTEIQLFFLSESYWIATSL